MNLSQIKSDHIQIGKGTFIHPSAEIRGINGNAKSIVIGDNCLIGKDVQIICDDFKMLDYGKIMNGTTVHGYNPCKIGYNFWCGQYSILDSIGGLTIGDNVGVGAHSQLWSHIKYGDTLEGCIYKSEKPLTIEDDCWFVGHVCVSPITAHRRSMALLGSVITRDMEENTVYKGCPAEATEWKQFGNPTPEQKLEKMLGYLSESNAKNVLVVMDKSEINFENDISYFCINDRKYKKTGSPDEVDFMKFLLPSKAKFVPYV